MRRSLVWIFTGFACAASGCSETPKGARAPTAEEMPGSVSVAGGKLVAGFASGRLKSDRALETYRIAKHPITVREYKACVAAGACSAPESAASDCVVSPRGGVGATYEGSEQAPVTCTTVPQAIGYCAWVGGTLPTADQWMLAARGEQPRRYAWGDDAPKCSRHPRGSGENGRACSDAPSLDVATHPEAVSPFGLQDVLATPSELLRSDERAQFPACARTGAACVVGGIEPGAIEFYAPASMTRDEERQNPHLRVYGFRCVWSGGAL